ncbi:MAG TPA: thioredoxin family protein [Bacteroidetes bacterium]|nr:thioredoxin family protein [Bacteroidota bacterium]
MKKFKIALFPLFLAGVFLLSMNNEIKELEVGSAGPMFDYSMDEVGGSKITLADVKGDNGTLLIFSCSTCPYVRAWEDRYLQISELAKELNIGMIAVNPNEAIRDNGASLADMKARSEEIGYTFPYALDKDYKLADAYGATRTPHVYLLNKDNTLVFVGAIDDNSRSAEDVQEYYLANAMRELAMGQPITRANSKAIGCTIKR